MQAGRGHIVVLSGEAGIGKSRLVQVVKDEIIGAAATRIEYRCSPYHQHSALYPIIAHLERALAFHRDDTPTDKLQKLEEALRPYPPPWRRRSLCLRRCSLCRCRCRIHPSH